MSELNVYLLAIGIIMVILFFINKMGQPKMIGGGYRCNTVYVIYGIIGLSVFLIINKFYMIV